MPWIVYLYKSPPDTTRVLEVSAMIGSKVDAVVDIGLEEKLPLVFGIELEYLFPNTTVYTLDDDDQARDRLSDVTDALKKVNITSIEFVNKIMARKSKTPAHAWKIVREWAGFELVSPPLTTLQPVRAAMSAMKEHGVGSHVLRTNFHTSIDATNQSMDQVRNLYKNFMAVEEALDTLRDCPQRADNNFKSLSVRQQFKTLQEGYSVLDSCGDYFYCLVEKAESVTAKEYDGDYIHQAHLRYDWKELAKEEGSGETRYAIWPKRLEFRGQQASTDAVFVTTWIKLIHNLVKSSFDGIVLEPKERTVDEAWNALFDELIRNDSVRASCEKRRRSL